MLSAYLLEWFGLLIRWFHFMMGAAWIGASFYFVWVNDAIRPPMPPKPGVAGELWAVHGGAFYEVKKYGGAPETLPETLHWFKWEAYLTWLSGFILLILHFWITSASTMLPAGSALLPWQGVAIGVGTLVVGWGVYDGLCRTPLKDRGTLLAVILGLYVTAVSYGLAQVLSPRAAWVHVGAMIGTWMAANVFFVIIPGQRAMVDAMIAGAPPPVERGKAGGLRSRHNNYLTLPVLLVMISSHFPSAWGHPQSWLILVALGLVGASYRHWVNLSERGEKAGWILPLALVGFVGIAAAARPAPPPVVEGEPVSMTRVQQIMATRCLGCHATEPIEAGFAAPPKGLVLETPDEIRAARDKIHQQVVVSKVMPLGNLTGMTDEERAIIARWTTSAR